MRKIKFRAWDIKLKKWIIGFDIDNNGNIWHNHFGHPDAILMQFIGLLDKNGKEIYEGDVVRATSRMLNFKTNIPTGKISIEDYYIIYVENEARFAKQIKGNCEHDVVKLRQESMTAFYEVIGNCFENPELLEDKNVD